MVNKFELRIGNILSDNGNQREDCYAVVTELTRWLVHLKQLPEGNTLTRKYEQVTPITFSPELLEACGFELVEGIVGQYELRTDRFLFSFYEGKNDIMIQDMKSVNTLARGIADNDLWNEVMGKPDGIVCPSCFEKEADKKGINIILKAQRI